MDRFVRSEGFTEGSIWVGFSIDEMERMRAYDSSARWNHSYPLIDLRMTRGDDSCKPLDEVDFSEELDLFSNPCASGMCFT